MMQPEEIYFFRMLDDNTVSVCSASTFPPTPEKLWRTSSSAAGGGAYRDPAAGSTGRAGDDERDESMAGASEKGAGRVRGRLK